MKEKIMTVLGEFTVEMSYKPIGEDNTLRKLTECLNNEALPHLQTGKTPAQAFEALDEANLEEKLFSSLTVGGGAGPRLNLYLKSRTISLSQF